MFLVSIERWKAQGDICGFNNFVLLELLVTCTSSVQVLRTSHMSLVSNINAALSDKNTSDARRKCSGVTNLDFALEIKVKIEKKSKAKNLEVISNHF